MSRNSLWLLSIIVVAYGLSQEDAQRLQPISLSEGRANATAASDWYCLADISTPLGISASGDIQCMSTDSINCLWGGGACSSKLNTANVRPLVCGADHKSKWGITGYDDPKHWCSRGRNTLGWKCLPGIDCPLSLAPGVDVRCMSLDGTNCLWGGGSCESKLNTGNLRPLVCGSDHKSKYGITGYESDNHWCYKGRTYFAAQLGWQCLAGIDVPVSVSNNGDVECMATDGQNCLWGDCQNKLLSSCLNPLTCGDVHKKFYGITGYDTPNHWCSKCRAILQPVCKPNCPYGAECGDNGCGGSCGQCAYGKLCSNSRCVCTPNCAGKECGDDGCGGQCGGCGYGKTCNNNRCVCTPNCAGKECGDDGCGGTCGYGCSGGRTCSGNKCVCTPNCAGKDCGDDGCGGTCGYGCSGGLTCSGNKCVCTPQCSNNECGDDGCGGKCGSCAPGWTCSYNNRCAPPPPPLPPPAPAPAPAPAPQYY